MSCTNSKKTGSTDIDLDNQCKNIMDSSWNDISIDQNFNEYLLSVNDKLKTLGSSKIKNISRMDSKACGKALITACLLKQHPAIDSVRITESCRGVSYRFREDGTWANVIVE